MPFDTRDWLCCPELKVLAPDVRGLWLDMLCYMWESPERGVMVKPTLELYTKREIVRMVGLDSEGTGRWLDSLIEAGVCGVRADGAIYSRRMVREEDLRQKRAVAGSKGGKVARSKEMSQKPQESQETEQSGHVTAQTDLFGQVDTPQQSKKRTKKAPEPKIEFAQYVHLTQREYDRLVADYGQEAAQWMIQKLNNTVGSNTKKYKYTNDNLAIRNWVVDCYFEKFGYGTTKPTITGGDSPGKGKHQTFTEIPD